MSDTQEVQKSAGFQMPKVPPQAMETTQLFNRIIQKAIMLVLSVASDEDCEKIKAQIRELAPDVKKLISLGIEATSEKPKKKK